ncbi:hypothetical protein, partial [Enterobacter hormaechei]|uniref:hypothetical protein n=2 Tax=Enterobacter hormaechei TaxID=158836 RepID=UPI002E2AACCE
GASALPFVIVQPVTLFWSGISKDEASIKQGDVTVKNHLARLERLQMRSAGAVGAVACAAPQGLIFSPVIHWHVVQNGLNAVDKQRGSTSRVSPAHLPVF